MASLSPAVTGCRYDAGRAPISGQALSGARSCPNGGLPLPLWDVNPNRHCFSREIFCTDLLSLFFVAYCAIGMAIRLSGRNVYIEYIGVVDDDPTGSYLP
jgi:hypothetical protein